MSGLSKAALRDLVDKAIADRSKLRNMRLTATQITDITSAVTEALRTAEVTSRFILTGQQLRVVKLSARGMTRAEVAKSLGITEHTVATHVADVLKILDRPNMCSAISASYARGWLEEMPVLKPVYEPRFSREFKLLRVWASGTPYHAHSRQELISETAIKSRSKVLLSRLCVPNKNQAVLMAHQQLWIPPNIPRYEANA